MTKSELWLGAMLRLAPRAFRERYGAEIVATHRERVGQAAATGRAALLRLYMRELTGVIWLVARLRLGGRPVRPPQPIGRSVAGGWLDGSVQDMRFALRTLRRSPAYAWTAIAVLGMGIGASSAIFSAFNAFFFRPLPFADADRVVMLYETNPEFGWTHESAAPANMLDWREQVGAFADVAAYSELVGRVATLLDDVPTVLNTVQVTGNFFSVLGVRPALGRTLGWEETLGGERRVIVLSHRAWLMQFGGDSTVIGRVIPFGSDRVEIVGVMPEQFQFPSGETQAWHTYAWTAENRGELWFRRAHFIRPIARLAAGVTPADAAVQLGVVVQRLQTDYPATNRVMGAGLMPARDFLIREVRRPLLILLGAAGLLLLLSCANVANLTLVRGAERGREFALRHALGAGRMRLGRQLLVESLVVAVAGGVVGTALGWAGVHAMAALTTLGIDGATAIALDGRVLAFTLAATVASGVLFGLAPAVRSTGGSLQATLVAGGTGASAGRASLRPLRLFVIAEVAVALLLVMGAALMTRSFLLMRDVDPGFRTTGALGVQLSAPAARYPNRDDVLAFQDRLLEALESRPAIERAGMVGQLPLAGPSWSSQLKAAGWPEERVGFEILHRRADAGYFAALGTPLLRGRMFERHDGPDSPPVVVINETFAREHFPGEDPLGQRIAYDRAPTENSTWYEIIGIVADQHQSTPAQSPRAEVFESRHQDWNRTTWLVLRTGEDPLATVATVRETLREIDPTIPIARVQPLHDVWRASMAREEFILTLLGIFGVVALLLAAVGVYGVTAQAARRRTREIGIRIALGARAPNVLGLMLRQSLATVSFGLVIGVAISLIATRALGSVLYGIAPHDALTLVSVIVLLTAVAGGACLLPAWRAMSLDPVRSLKQE